MRTSDTHEHRYNQVEQWQAELPTRRYARLPRRLPAVHGSHVHFLGRLPMA